MILEDIKVGNRIIVTNNRHFSHGIIVNITIGKCGIQYYKDGVKVNGVSQHFTHQVMDQCELDRAYYRNKKLKDILK